MQIQANILSKSELKLIQLYGDDSNIFHIHCGTQVLYKITLNSRKARWTDKKGRTVIRKSAGYIEPCRDPMSFVSEHWKYWFYFTAKDLVTWLKAMELDTTRVEEVLKTLGWNNDNA